MDITLTGMIEILKQIGPLGLVIFFWWYDNRRIWIVFDEHKKELDAQRAQFNAAITGILKQYQQDMLEQREMYRANASLCRDFASVTQDLRSIVTLNIQKMTEVGDAVRQNQFCPQMRIDKKIVQIGKQGETGQ